jgi:DNA-binding transcriptional LysR family regulator
MLPDHAASLHTQPMFDWNDLKYFLALAREGSTVAAAKALGVNQSTVQRRLAVLEEQLGRTLIERNPTGYQLTKLGEELKPHAERIEDAIAAFERHLVSFGTELTGTVHVTCPAAVADRLTRAALIDQFHARYTGLRVELVMSERFLDLSKGEADIAIRAGESPDDALVGRKIGEGHWGVYASRSYVERHGRPERPEDIERHFVVAFDGAIAHYPAAQWLHSVAPYATVAARSDNWPGFVLAVKSGAGLAPLLISEGDRDDELVRVIENIPELVTNYYLLTHRDLRRTPRIRAFFDFVDAEITTFRAVLSGKVDCRGGERRKPHRD